MKKINWFLLCVLIIATAALTLSGQPAETAKKVKCPGKVAVQVETIKQENFLEYRYFTGQGQAAIVAVKSPVNGLISEIKVSEGSLVDAGQELAVLNAGLAEEIKKLADEAARLKKILTARRNWKEKSEKAIQAAEKNYQKAQELLDEKKAQADRVIKAPVAGTVHLVVASGSAVVVDAVLLEITDPKQMVFQFSLTANENGLLAVGDKISGSNDNFKSEVSADVIAVSESQATFRVNNNDNQVKEGITFTFKKLQAEHADAIAIPTLALQKDSLGDYVYVVDKKKAKKLYITTEAVTGAKTMISKGLAADTQLIVSGFACLADGKKINVVKQEELTKDKNAELARQEAEALAKEKAELRAKEKAEAQAKKEAKEQVKREAEALAKEKAELRAKEKAEARAKKEAEALAKKEAKAQAKLKKKELALENKKVAEAANEKEALPAEEKVKCPGKVAVQVETVKRENFPEYRYFSGQGQTEIVVVKSPVIGLLSELKVSDGSLVDAGQELAVLNAGMAEEIKKLTAEAAKMKKILINRQNWKVKNEKAIQAAERDYQKAQELLDEKKVQADRVIKAPVAGTVHLLAASGSAIVADAVLLEITDPKQMVFQFSLTANENELLAVGDKISGSNDNFKSEVSAEVIAVNESQATFRVNNNDNQVKEGITFTFKKLQADHADAIAIPTTAIQQDNLGDYVYVIDKKKAKKLYVTLGAASEGKTMILQGLVADTQLIVSGFACLANGKKIRIINQEELPRLKKEAETRKEKEVGEVETTATAVAAGIEEFITYLEANKEALQYDRYEKTEVNGLAAVKIYSGVETQKKLLDILGQFAIKEVGFELKDALIVSTITFKKAEQIAVGKKLTADETRMRRMLLGSRLRIGIHGTYFMIQGKTFKSAYGAALPGFGAELSFRFTPKIDFWVSGGMANKKIQAELAGASYEMQFKMVPFLSAAIRYYLLNKDKISTFAGAGANVFMVKDTGLTGDIKTTAIGFHALAGMYYRLGGKFHGQLLAKYNIVKKDLFSGTSLAATLDLSGLELLLGVAYSL